MAAWQERRNAAVEPDLLAELKSPAEFDSASRDVAPEEIGKFIPLITRGNELVEECATCGFAQIYIHNVSRNQHEFVDFRAEHVFSELKLRFAPPPRPSSPLANARLHHLARNSISAGMHEAP